MTIHEYGTDNYTMQDNIPECSGKLQYWHGDKEGKERTIDIRYVKEYFPHTAFIKFSDMGHASMASLYPQKMLEQFELLMKLE